MRTGQGHGEVDRTSPPSRMPAVTSVATRNAAINAVQRVVDSEGAVADLLRDREQDPDQLLRLQPGSEPDWLVMGPASSTPAPRRS
jgi:hypothetical protein